MPSQYPRLGVPNQPFKRHYRPQEQDQRTHVASNYFSPPSTHHQSLQISAPPPQIHSHPAIDDSVDIPLDAFDKQLLAEIPLERQHEAGSGRDKISFPTKPQSGLESKYQDEQTFRSDLHDIGQPFDASLSVEAASSPTVAALQNRRLYESASGAARPSIGKTSTTNHPKPNHYPSIGTRQAHKRSLPELDHAYIPRKNQAMQKRESAAPSDELALAHAPPIMRGIRLICTSDLPDKVRTIFPYEVLNAVQSKCYPTAYQSDDNLVVSAPTGSGKTAIMELAICRVAMNCHTTDFKIVYQAPTKALCNERYHDWEKKFKVLGLECAELTGDTERDHLRKVQQARIIITTPEKWDSITRKWRDNVKLVQMIKLFLVDEVHILKDQRGATLEAVISRMKSIGTSVRFVALSATVPNPEDIASWLGKDPATPNVPACREVFDESFRPVRLDKHVYGFQYGANDFGFDNVLRKHVPDVIVTHGKKKPAMVFCMTRKSSAMTATNLAAFWSTTHHTDHPWPAPTSPIAVDDGDLRKIVHTGVAFHHGGLSPQDRNAVEQGFLHGSISVICSTSTLAVGVNLPCYLVVLQGTTTWTGNSGLQNYSDLEIMQMLGRAGRPQYETSACAVILTRDHQTSRYENLVTGQELLESTLHRNLIEHLNAEIGLGTIHDMESAKHWLASTFLKVRLARNPGHYRLEGTTDGVDAEDVMQKLCEKDIELLLHADLIENTDRIKCTALGDAMARYCANFETMKTFAAVPPRAKISEILSILTQAAEFAEIRVRSGEKAFYKELNKRAEIMFPVNVDIALPTHKVSVILQSELGGASLPDGDHYRKYYQQHGIDKAVVFGHANRLIRCIIDCQLHMKDGVSARNALELGRSLAAKAWDSTPRQLKQLPDIGDVSCRKLAAKGINSIEKLLNSEPHQLEMALGRPQTFGNALLNKLATYPLLRVSVREMGRDMKPGKGIDLKLKCEIGFLNEKVPLAFNKVAVYVCFLVEGSDGTLIDFRRFSAAKLGNGEDIFLIAHLEKSITHVRCYVMCDEIVGTCRYAELQVGGIPLDGFPASTKPGSSKRARGPSDKLSHVTSKPVFADETTGRGDRLATSQHEGIEVVDDIDDLLLAAERDNQTAQVKKVSRKPSIKSDNGEQPEWKEPTQLPNGRWTCQHLCREKGLQCKHKCCHEGVVKPRKRPNKLATGNNSDAKQQKITSMAGGVGKASNVHTSQKDDESYEEAGPGDAHYNGETIEAIMTSIRANSASKQQETREDPPAADPSDEARKEGDPKPGANLVTLGRRLSISTDNQVFDVEDKVFDAIDCDWNGSGTMSTYDDVHEHNNQAGANDKDKVLDDMHHTAAPHSHVSMQDVQKEPDQHFISTRQSSSPFKGAPPMTVDEPMLDDPDVLGDAFDDEPSLATDSGYSPATLAAVTPASDDFDDPLPYSRSQAASSASVTAFPKTELKQETDEETAKRLWHEDQARKWAALPPWMFEQFGQFVDLID